VNFIKKNVTYNVVIKLLSTYNKFIIKTTHNLPARCHSGLAWNLFIFSLPVEAYIGNWIIHATYVFYCPGLELFVYYIHLGIIIFKACYNVIIILSCAFFPVHKSASSVNLNRRTTTSYSSTIKIKNSLP